MFKKLFPFFIFAIVQCSPNHKLNEYGKTFFSMIDQGKYDIAFNMLSVEDKMYSTIQDFSLKLQEIKDSYFYPDKLDSSISYSLTKMPDSLLMKAMNSKIPFPKNTKRIFIFKELRRIPDMSTISKSSNKEDYFEKKSEMQQKLLSGNFPTILDSERYVVLIMTHNKPAVYIGAKYWKARDSLLDLYSSYVENNILISVNGNAEIYRTVRYEVVGLLNYELKNNTRDTLMAYSIKVRGKFNGIYTDPKYIVADQDGFTPKSTYKGKIIFHDDYFRNLLSYSSDETWVNGDIEITTYPKWGNGPDYDSIMALKPNTMFEEFSMPIKRGVKKFMAGL